MAICIFDEYGPKHQKYKHANYFNAMSITLISVLLFQHWTWLDFDFGLFQFVRDVLSQTFVPQEADDVKSPPCSESKFWRKEPLTTVS